MDCKEPRSQAICRGEDSASRTLNDARGMTRAPKGSSLRASHLLYWPGQPVGALLRQVPRPMESLVTIWSLLIALGWAGFLLASRWSGQLPDRGYCLGRVLGLATWGVVVAVPWTLGLVSLSRATAWAGLFVVVLVALFCVRSAPESLRHLVVGRWRLILACEMVFAMCGGFFAFIVAHCADVAPGVGERFMDFSLIQAIGRSGSFPVEDSWFAGQPVPYYFFGHFLMSLIRITTNLDPFSFFPCAVASVLALAAIVVFGLGLNIRGSIGEGVLGLFLGMFCGTLYPFTSSAWQGPWRPIDWFGAARAIHEAMTEWPAFIWINSDLHAHVIVMPFLVALAVRGLSHVRTLGGFVRGRDTGMTGCWIDLLLLAAALATSALDGAVAFVLLVFLSGAREVGSVDPWSLRLGRAAGRLGFLFVGAVLLASPFSGAVAAQGRGLARVSVASGAGEYLVQWGIPLGLLVVGLVPSIACGLRNHPKVTVLGLGAVLGAVVVRPDGIGLSVSVVLLVLIALATVQFEVTGSKTITTESQRPETAGGASSRPPDSMLQTPARSHFESHPDTRLARVFVLTLALVACLLLLICEVVYVRVAYGPTFVGRCVMTNKLFVHAWLFLGAANAALLFDGVRWAQDRLFDPGGRVWPIALGGAFVALLMALGTYYPILGTLSRCQFFVLERRLWGGKVITTERSEDWQAARWLAEQPGERPVVLEAPGESYGWCGRLAALGGCVTVLGWTYHEASWRNSWNLVTQRKKEVDEIYRMAISRPEIERRLDRYRVRYIAVGKEEKSAYPADTIKWLVAPYRPVLRLSTICLYERLLATQGEKRMPR